jgi:hypothetical protein
LNLSVEHAPEEVEEEENFSSPRLSDRDSIIRKDSNSDDRELNP